MKNATLALLGGIIGSILYSWMGVFVIFLTVWVFGVVITYNLLELNFDEDEEKIFVSGLFFSFMLWPIVIPVVFFIDRAHFCKFFHLPHFEFRLPIHIIQKTEE